jgi:RNAse (barnase) inhibitor barstar
MFLKLLKQKGINSAMLTERKMNDPTLQQLANRLVDSVLQYFESDDEEFRENFTKDCLKALTAAEQSGRDNRESELSKFYDDLREEFGIAGDPSKELFTEIMRLKQAQEVLPYDIDFGSVKFRKGVKLETFINAARRWYQEVSASMSIEEHFVVAFRQSLEEYTSTVQIQVIEENEKEVQVAVMKLAAETGIPYEELFDQIKASQVFWCGCTGACVITGKCPAYSAESVEEYGRKLK